jgi:hypothetical protein
MSTCGEVFEFKSKCEHAQKVGCDIWCDKCDGHRSVSSCRNLHSEISIKVLYTGRYPYNPFGNTPQYYYVIHKLYKFHNSLHLCYGCNEELSCLNFTSGQIAKRHHRRKCRTCQTENVKLQKNRSDIKRKRCYIEPAMKINVREGVSDMNILLKYYLTIPGEDLAACLLKLVISPPEAVGPHYLAHLSDGTYEWISQLKKFYYYKDKLTTKLVNLYIVPADMCPTQVRLQKPVQRVDTSLLFIRLIASFLLKKEFPTDTFTNRGFRAGVNNSVQVDSEYCRGGCGKMVLTCKALPYCPSCNCAELQQALCAESLPPKYNKNTNSVVDWARKALMDKFSKVAIKAAIYAMIQTKFWTKCVEFAMEYDSATQSMRSEYLSSMCGICGGPCGVYIYFENMSTTVTTGNGSPKLPWNEAHYDSNDNQSPVDQESKENLKIELNSTKFCRNKESFIASEFTPTQLFGNTAKQIKRSQHRLLSIKETFDNLSL